MITLGEGILNKLREHLEEQRLVIAVAGNRWQEHNLILSSSVGTPFNTSNLRKDFLRTSESAGLEKMRFHNLRHTAASLMLNNGVPVIVVSKILDHAKVSTTLDLYSHLINEMQDEAIHIVDTFEKPIRVEMPEKSVI